MPLYEYECQSCGRRTEVIQRFSDAPLAACPDCGASVRRLPSAPAVQFKGSGWYVTDYGGRKSGSDSEEKKGTEKKDSEAKKSGKGAAAKESGGSERAGAPSSAASSSD